VTNITEELNKIKNATYGRDVRGAIHDAIKKTYDDASENGNANMEVELARGTFPNLNARLNSIDTKINNNQTQLNQIPGQINSAVASKAEKSYVDNQLASKVNQDEFNTEKGRIDNLVANAGNTDGNAELLDIRVGWDGVIYPTAGDAVRSIQQFMIEENEEWVI